MEKGFGKRTPLKMFKMQLRGGMGIRAAQVTSRTGTIVGMKIVYGDDYDVILASSKGQMIRMALKTIKRLQRDTQGVTLIKLNQGDRVTSVTVVKKDQTDKLEDIPEEPLAPEEPPTEGPAEEVQEPKEEEPKPTPAKEDIIKEKKPKKPKKTPTKKMVKPRKSRIKKITPPSPTPPEPEPERGVAEVTTLPDWAKVHTDSWRQPDIFKPRKNIKVHNYADEIGSAKGRQKPEEKKSPPVTSERLPLEEEKKEPPKSSEPNYWGGRL